MNKKNNRVELPEGLLSLVEKPTRYTGNEWNIPGAGDGTAARDSEAAAGGYHTRFAFCFPDTYEIGMSHLGLRILYDTINRRADASCERVFAPWDDMERLMRERGIPLFALESRDALGAFDLLGFSLQYELSYSNVLNMLDLAGISPIAAERADEDPIVCAGGPCVCNPAPMSRYVDFFTPGEGEDVIHDILDLYGAMKAAAPSGGRVSKRDFLRELSRVAGVYVPTVHLGGARIKKRVVADIDASAFPERGLVPNMGIVHDRIVLEVFRGCSRGCRFCQAGFIYRPVREKTPDTLVAQACALADSTGYEEIALSSLSTSDYTGLAALTEKLVPAMAPKRVNISLPSLRVDSFSLALAESASNVRRSGLTFAPEAGTQRLRDVINKGVTEEDILRSVSLAFNAGWSTIKLYFMIGLPTETYEDLDGIGALARKIVAAYYNVPREKRGRGLNVTVGCSSFVPKPFTPFQWEAQDDIETLRKKQRYLKDLLRMKHVAFNWHDADTSYVEAVLARGDAAVGDAVYEAWKAGARLEGWGEFFKLERWAAAFERAGADAAGCANRTRAGDEPLPWDVLDYGVTKAFLLRERDRAYSGLLTSSCREFCSACGVREAYGCGLADAAGCANRARAGVPMPEGVPMPKGTEERGRGDGTET